MPVVLQELVFACAQSLQTICNPVDCYLPGSSVHGIFQARMLEWAIEPSSRGSSDPGIEPRSAALQADSLPLSHWGSPSFNSITQKKKSITPQGVFFLHQFSVLQPICLDCLVEISTLKPEKLNLWSVTSVELQDFHSWRMDLPSIYFCKPDTWESSLMPSFPLHIHSINWGIWILLLNYLESLHFWLSSLYWAGWKVCLGFSIRTVWIIISYWCWGPHSCNFSILAHFLHNLRRLKYNVHVEKCLKFKYIAQ